MLLEDQVRGIAEYHLKKINRWPVSYDLRLIDKEETDQYIDKLRRKFFRGDQKDFDAESLAEEWGEELGVKPAAFEPYYHISYEYSTPIGNKGGFFSINAKTGNVLSAGEQG